MRLSNTSPEKVFKTLEPLLNCHVSVLSRGVMTAALLVRPAAGKQFPAAAFNFEGRVPDYAGRRTSKNVKELEDFLHVWSTGGADYYSQISMATSVVPSFQCIRTLVALTPAQRLELFASAKLIPTKAVWKYTPT